MSHVSHCWLNFTCGPNFTYWPNSLVDLISHVDLISPVAWLQSCEGGDDEDEDEDEGEEGDAGASFQVRWWWYCHSNSDIDTFLLSLTLSLLITEGFEASSVIIKTNSQSDISEDVAFGWTFWCVSNYSETSHCEHPRDVNTFALILRCSHLWDFTVLNLNSFSIYVWTFFLRFETRKFHISFLYIPFCTFLISSQASDMYLPQDLVTFNNTCLKRCT